MKIKYQGKDTETGAANVAAFLEENGYTPDFSEKRLHHEIYLSDARKTAPDKLKTVIRHPIRPKE